MSDFLGALREGDLMRMLTGSSGSELADRASRGETPLPASMRDPSRSDLDTHALTLKLIADRFGPMAARTAGIGNELIGGAMSSLKGQGFGGETGFDFDDLRANEEGIAASNRERAEGQNLGSALGIGSAISAIPESAGQFLMDFFREKEEERPAAPRFQLNETPPESTFIRG